ncbi:hypothetical protein FHG87_010065 [Trinorchestia longiramus]|nr:hypothetical protein FHG87_010065 [Trinorchestia longiramus]
MKVAVFFALAAMAVASPVYVLKPSVGGSAITYSSYGAPAFRSAYVSSGFIPATYSGFRGTYAASPAGIAIARSAPTVYSKFVPATYSATKIVPAGYKAEKIIPATYSATKIIPATYSATKIVPPGYKAEKVVPATYSATKIVSADYKAEKVVPATYSATKIVPTDYKAEKVVPATYSATKIIPDGYKAEKVIPTTYIAGEGSKVITVDGSDSAKYLAKMYASPVVYSAPGTYSRAAKTHQQSAAGSLTTF